MPIFRLSSRRGRKINSSLQGLNSSCSVPLKNVEGQSPGTRLSETASTPTLQGAAQERRAKVPNSNNTNAHRPLAGMGSLFKSLFGSSLGDATPSAQNTPLADGIAGNIQTIQFMRNIAKSRGSDPLVREFTTRIIGNLRSNNYADEA